MMFTIILLRSQKKHNESLSLVCSNFKQFKSKDFTWLLLILACKLLLYVLDFSILSSLPECKCSDLKIL